MPDAFGELVRLVERLRRECPWDREQTLRTLETYLLEESYEVLDALSRQDPSALRSELGDLLFQILFLCRIAEERGWFDVQDVAAAIARKMIDRHPHVFEGETAADAQAVRASWEKRKRRKDAASSDPLDGIPANLPALSTALRMSARAADLGFDWERTADILEKVEEEIAEAKAALERGSPEELEEEIGDLLFAIANWARRGGIDPESALRRANRKFRRRFRLVAEMARAGGRDVAECGVSELDAYWSRVKDAERRDPKPGPG
jgi:MazG family protein